MADTRLSARTRRKQALARLQVRHEYRDDPTKEEITANIHKEALARQGEAGRAKLVTDVVDRLPLAHRLWFALAVLALAAYGLWLRFGR